MFSSTNSASDPDSEKILENISVDCVIFGYDENELKVLVRKESVLFNNRIYTEWKLPGNHVRRNETIDTTALRILKEQTGLEKIYVKQFMVFSDPDRLKKRSQDYEWIKPRLIDDRVLTVGFYSLINIKDIDNSLLIEDAKWTNAYDIQELMFDHKEIFDEALIKLRYDLLHDPIVFELLPRKFTLTQMQRLYEAIFNTVYDKRNFRKKVGKIQYVIPLNETQTKVPHSPARYYMFDRNLYEQTKRDRFDFKI